MLKKNIIPLIITSLLFSQISISNAADAADGQLEMNNTSMQQQQYDQNGQKDKLNFVKQKPSKDIISGFGLIDKVTPYEIMAGTVIPGVLITGINSDLPGQILGMVSQNVFDSIEGKYLLIPQGTKLIGIYDSKTTYAQERALVIWQRLIFPNGKSIILENLQGTDQAGYSGLKDKVNSHFGRVIWSSLLGGLITGAVASKTDVSSDDKSIKAEAGAEAARNFSAATNSIVQKNLQIQPTVIIRPGYQFNVMLSKDILLEPYID